MPQLDRFLSVLVSRGADSIELVEGEAAALVAGAASQPITKPLTAQQLLTLLREIAPGDALNALETGEPTVFTYASGDATFSVRARNDGNRWEASIRREGNGNGKPTPAGNGATAHLTPTEPSPAARSATPAAISMGTPAA